MTWWLVLYAVSGILLTLLMLSITDELDAHGVQLALIAGPFVGVPAGLFFFLFFVNWLGFLLYAGSLAWKWARERLKKTATSL